MSRHSKWSKVKQFKGAVDAKRSASFTKLAREITVAAREKGPDPSMNVRLRVAMDRARKASMPKDAIERAVVRGAGTGADAAIIESLTYEAYAPGGTALVVECLTDNRNRSANDVKHALSKHEANLASQGSVTYLFDKKAVVKIQGGLPADKRDEMELALIDVGAEDIEDVDGTTEVRGAPADLSKLADAAQKLGLTLESAEFEWIPKSLVETNEENGTKVAELIDELENLDDVAHVYSNLA
ncbi:MAG: YebC/PmpR family DNA-binding transcriptional regulator [Patescibacteria group bacterium]